MSEANKNNLGMFEIHPGSPEWDAWLKHYRGTKNEARMLSCLGSRLAPPRPWLERSKLPPSVPPGDHLTRNFGRVVESSLPQERLGTGWGKIDEIADRLNATLDRHTKETELKTRRRKENRRTERAFEDALIAVREGREPYINGGDNLGTLDGVPDVDKHGHPGLFTKIVNLRDDPVGQMAKRGQLGTMAERACRLKAARYWQRLYEMAEIGGARGIDPTREPVDGGRFELPDTDVRLGAQATLNRLRRALGIIGDRLVTWVLGQKLNLSQAAGRLNKSARMDQVALGYRFRECLDTIAEELGIALDGKGACGPHRRRDEFDDLARHAHDPVLYRAVGLATAELPPPVATHINKSKPLLRLRDPS